MPDAVRAAVDRIITVEVDDDGFHRIEVLGYHLGTYWRNAPPFVEAMRTELERLIRAQRAEMVEQVARWLPTAEVVHGVMGDAQERLTRWLLAVAEAERGGRG